MKREFFTETNEMIPSKRYSFNGTIILSLTAIVVCGLLAFSLISSNNKLNHNIELNIEYMTENTKQKHTIERLGDTNQLIIANGKAQQRNIVAHTQGIESVCATGDTKACDEAFEKFNAKFGSL